MGSSQLVIAGFPEGVRARELAEYLESVVGLVSRCRVKTSPVLRTAIPILTPPGRDRAREKPFREESMAEHNDETQPLPPHAFVHFSTPEVAHLAVWLAKRKQLSFGGQTLIVVQDDNPSGRLDFTEMNTTTTTDSNKNNSEVIRLTDVNLTLGYVSGACEMVSSWVAPTRSLCFVVDQTARKVRFEFDHRTHFYRHRGMVRMTCNFRMEFLVRDIWDVRREKEGYGDGDLRLLIHMRVPPRISYRTADDDIHEHSLFLPPDDDNDPWIRTVDVTPDKSLGRCFLYRISVSVRQMATFRNILSFFDDSRLLDACIHPPISLRSEPKDIKLSAKAWFFTVPSKVGIPFDVMFLINGIVHKGIFSPVCLNPTFYRVIEQSLRVNHELTIVALRRLISYKRPILNPTKYLEQTLAWLRSNPARVTAEKRLRSSNMEVRRLVITPTKGYCVDAQAELSNRVIRKYKDSADRFIRVSFLDENMQPISPHMLLTPVAPIVREVCQSAPLISRTAIHQRVRMILLQGFSLCDRNYQFLAFSANQLRDHSAWFYAGNVYHIRNWMGDFPKENVARFAARMGQCFSSTYRTIDVPESEVDQAMPDIQHDGYNFSDGIGKINPDLALEVAKMLNLEIDPPSAYQIRYGGCKGVVAVWPKENMSNCLLALRPSMRKFASNHQTLEIVSWTKFLPCFLNRQIITLLSSLKVDNQVFIKLQDIMVNNLTRILDSPDTAFNILAASCSSDLRGTSLEMLSSGFHPLCEPYLRSMLEAIKTVQLDEVQNKARIFVPEGRWLMGTLDELGELEYGQCFVRVSSPPYNGRIPTKLTGLSYWKSEPEVITGKIILAKNPCLHPGDVRVLEAVDVKSLYHLRDCVVLPQKGHRPHANEASGSDLDGDLYFICWDKCLIPPTGDSWEPMDYVAPVLKDTVPSVTPEELVNFFLKHMLSDNLGKICNAHVVHADLSEDGALDEKCLELAKLAAMAVDSPKTGVAAIMPYYLRPTKYPDFMGKFDKPMYTSKKILGILYRKIKGHTGKELGRQQQELSQMDRTKIVYDVDLAVDGFEEFLSDSWKYKRAYDEKLGNLMAQYDIQSEGEVVTGHFISSIKYNSKRQGDIKERVKNSYAALREEFRAIFDGRIGGNVAEEAVDIREKHLEAKASAWYHVCYHEQWLDKVEEQNKMEDILDRPYLLSFAWIAVDILCRIKTRKLQAYEAHNQAVSSFQ